MQRPSGEFGVLLAALVALLLVGFGWLVANDDLFPPNSLPWKPMTLDAPPRAIAHWQLNRLKRDPGRCRTVLAAALQLRFTPLADGKKGDACGFDNVVRTESAPVVFTPAVIATCNLTAALYWYQRQLAPVALAHMHSRLTGITQLGTFACRNVNNEPDAHRSEHATANAIDIASFHFADGRTVSVLKDYDRNSDAGRFLDVAHEQACRLFNAVLGPHYNKQHANHFHLDMGGSGICS